MVQKIAIYVQRMWVIDGIILLFVITTSESHSLVLNGYRYAPEHEYPPSDYSFSYGVKDLHTGDVKHQWEKKTGETVVGHYSVLEADGSIRIVDYTADDKNGFNAVVKHKGPSFHPVQKPVSHTQFQKADPKPRVKDTYLFIPKEEQSSADLNEYSEESKDLKSSSELPVDLNLLKPDVKDAVDVSLIKPIEIDLTHLSKDESATAELSDEELANFYREYYKTEHNVPYFEKGFQPITTEANIVKQRAPVPQTYRTNKKPVTTPGLKHFSTRPRYVIPQRGARLTDRFGGPVLFPKNFEAQIQNSQIKRLYRSMANKDVLDVRYVSDED